MNVAPLAEACRICRNKNWEVFYRGPIRRGKFGHWTDSDRTIWRCGNCRAGYLPDEPSGESPGAALDYERDEYRDLYDGSHSPEDYYRLHDAEQAERLSVLGLEGLRGKTIADVGAGAGSFLDLVQGLAARTIAVEPYGGYHQALADKGHLVYSYAEDARPEYRGALDRVVSFAVLEHVPRPLDLLKEIQALLKPDGALLISTPNYEDWLMEFLPGVYDKFFFRTAHRWYFNGDALRTLGRLAGFNRVEIQYQHRFDLSNALNWIRDGRPTGKGRWPVLKRLDDVYRRELADLGRADYIYAWFRP